MMRDMFLKFSLFLFSRQNRKLHPWIVFPPKLILKKWRPWKLRVNEDSVSSQRWNRNLNAEKKIFSLLKCPTALQNYLFCMSGKRIIKVATALCFNLGKLCSVVKNSFELLAKWRLLLSPLSKWSAVIREISFGRQVCMPNKTSTVQRAFPLVVFFFLGCAPEEFLQTP